MQGRDELNQTQDPFSNPDLAPSKELIDLVERQITRDAFYAKGRDMYGFTHYDETNSSETGCGINLEPVLPENIDDKQFNNSYIFAEETSELFYIRDDRVENVRIDDIEKFKKLLAAEMENESYKYSRKHLNCYQIYNLITSNGGHSPGKDDDLIEKANENCRKTKDYFYDKDRDVACFSFYKKNASESGCGIHWETELPNNLNNEHFEDSYVFVRSIQTLFYIRGGQAEEVKINDMEKFTKSFKEIMKTQDYKYYRKHLSHEEINTLITSNGGHIPATEQSKQKSEQKTLAKSPLMQDLFPRKQIQDKSAEHNQDIHHRLTHG